MLKQRNFIAIVKFHDLLPEFQLNSLLQSQGLVETDLSSGQIKVWSFQGNELDLSFKEAGLKSEIVSQYLTLIDIGLAPEDESIAFRTPRLATNVSYQLFLQKTINQIQLQ